MRPVDVALVARFLRTNGIMFGAMVPINSKIPGYGEFRGLSMVQPYFHWLLVLHYSFGYHYRWYKTEAFGT
jgi:hypothetical protein